MQKKKKEILELITLRAYRRDGGQGLVFRASIYEHLPDRPVRW